MFVTFDVSENIHGVPFSGSAQEGRGTIGCIGGSEETAERPAFSGEITKT